MNLAFFIRELVIGGTSYLKALRFIFKERLYFFYLAPIVIGIFFWTFGLVGIGLISDWITGLFEAWFGVTVDNSSINWMKEYRNFFEQAGQIILVLFLKLTLIYLVYKLNKYVLLILISPFLAYLSERVEAILYGKDFPFNWRQFIKDVWRGIIIALRNMIIEISVILMSWLLTFFMPFLLPFTTVFLLLVSAYYYGFSMLDYTNERKRLNLSESVRFIRRHKGLAIGNGLTFHLILIIPFLGTIIAPITATVAATLGMLELDDYKKKYDSV
jgi:CysZ protein